MPVTSTTYRAGDRSARAGREAREVGASPASMLRGVDYVEWWVGSARAFCGFLQAAFGFRPVAHAGPETGRRDRVSHVMEQGEVRFVVTGALSAGSEVADHVRRHGDGVRDVGFRVDDVEAVYEASVGRGALDVRPPTADEDDGGVVRHAAIGTYGETVHTLLDRSGYNGPFLPGFGVSPLTPASAGPVGLERIDHVVGNVERGRLADWVAYYEDVLGFEQLLHFGQEQISTESSALASTVMWNRGNVVLPINEPADGRRKSQIEEYLDHYGAPGVQHLALHTPDIVGAVRAMRRRGVGFLRVPGEYYDEARERMAGFDLDWDALTEAGILVDRDAGGYLLQIFTEPVADRPTVFFEIIQREGARGFGEGNFKALFEAIERAQAARGNL